MIFRCYARRRRAHALRAIAVITPLRRLMPRFLLPHYATYASGNISQIFSRHSLRHTLAIYIVTAYS